MRQNDVTVGPREDQEIRPTLGAMRSLNARLVQFAAPREDFEPVDSECEFTSNPV
jgi:hypothetical protein